MLRPNFRDSIYMAASNVPKDRMTSDDLYVYNSSTSSVTLSPAQDKKLVPCEIANQIMSIFKGRFNDQQMICITNKQTSTIINIHVYCLLFLERKSTGAVLHCNGKVPCLASLLYSGTEFKMKNQGIIKVKLNKFHSNCFLKNFNKSCTNKHENDILFCNILGSIQRGAKKELQHG